MKILISVASLIEAEAAIKGKCDILDLKDVREGSLGAPSPFLIEQIKKVNTNDISLSIAIGDVYYQPNTIALAVKGAALFSPDYIKIGLKGIQSKKQAQTVLSCARKVLMKDSPSTKLVAGCYADYFIENSISPMELIELLDQELADFCLVDTLKKDGKSIFDHLSDSSLRHIVSCCRRNKVKVALAGSIQICHLPRVKSLEVNAVGVRGAVCEANQRHNVINEKQLSDFLYAARN